MVVCKIHKKLKKTYLGSRCDMSQAPFPFPVVSFPCPSLAPYACQLLLVMVVDQKLKM